jgi:hypothetical protein
VPAIALFVAALFFTSGTPNTKAAPVPCNDPHTVVSCLSLEVTDPGSTIIISPAGPSFSATSHVINTKTNAPGYNLKLSTNTNANTLDHTPALTPTNPTISPTSGTPTLPAALNPNSWGYSLTGASNSYAAVPTNTSPITIDSTASGDDAAGNDTTVYYGVSVNHDQAAGTYQTTVVYTATANPFPDPTITAEADPADGPLAGGTSINITGTNFYDTSAVKIDGKDCTTYTVNSPTSITCITPAGDSSGDKTITVTTAHGTNSRANSFTYQNPIPIVTSISPSSGHFRGGETFTITGQYFSGVTGAANVKLGASNCRSYTVNSDTEITCVSSGLTSGLDGPNNTMTAATTPVKVTVSNSSGDSIDDVLFTYRYINSSFASGSSYVDIRGTDIVLGSRLFVDGVECANYKITSTATATCVSPARSTGAKTVSIQAPVSDGTIQNYSDCSTLSVGDIRILTDNRDSQNYRIRKMEDGKCWMIDNLKLKGGITLTAANTNFDGTEAIAFATAWKAITSSVQSSTTHTRGRCLNAAGDTVRTPTNGSSLTCDGSSTQSADNNPYIAYSDPAAQTTAAAGWNCNNQVMINPNSLTNCGYLYNWYTATAGSGSYGTTDSVTSSICPAGWRLP